MSNNDLYCGKCKSHHHPVECPNDLPSPFTEKATELVCDMDLETGEFRAAVKAIATALELAHREGLESLIAKIKNIDPLKAECNWENGDDIAVAVKDYIISTLGGVK